MEETPGEGAVADVYNAQQHVHYAAWWLKKRGEGREGVSSRSAAFKIYACLLQCKQNRSRRNALFCCLGYRPRTQRVGRLGKCKAVGNNGKAN